MAPRKAKTFGGIRINFGNSVDGMIAGMLSEVPKEALFSLGEIVRFHRITDSLGAKGKRLEDIMASGVARARRKRERANNVLSR